MSAIDLGNFLALCLWKYKIWGSCDLNDIGSVTLSTALSKKLFLPVSRNPSLESLALPSGSAKNALSSSGDVGSGFGLSILILLGLPLNLNSDL